MNTLFIIFSLKFKAFSSEINHNVTYAAGLLTHFPNSIVFDGENANPLPNSSFTNLGIISSGSSFNMGFPDLNGYPLKSRLSLYTDMTENDFIAKLIECGIYVGSVEENKMFDEIGNWESCYNFNYFRIIHKPTSIIYEDKNGKKSFTSALNLNSIVFSVKSTKENFERQLQKLIKN